MPPITRIQKEDIIQTAYEIAKKEGMEGINARAIAKKMNTSIQPIFYKFTNMEELKEEVMEKIIENYKNRMQEATIHEDIYKHMGMNYIQFAKEEPKLFQILFMSNQGVRPETLLETKNNVDNVVEYASDKTGFSREKAKQFHIKIWIFTHGLATMLTTNTCKFTEEEISQMLTDIYTAFYDKEMERGK